MTFVSILETLILGPLKLLFEFVYHFSKGIVGNPALAIIAMSLVVNVLSFPLYRRADIMQEEAKSVENKLRNGVNHIKKSFSGDERMMMLQTYSRVSGLVMSANWAMFMHSICRFMPRLTRMIMS